MQNITTVCYLLDLYEPTEWRHPLQPFMPTPSLGHCKHWSTVSEKRENQFLWLLSVRCLTDWKQSLTRTASHSCRDPETRMLFMGARWRPTQAALCRVCRRLELAYRRDTIGRERF